jgi:hypothetical protein
MPRAKTVPLSDGIFGLANEVRFARLGSME